MYNVFIGFDLGAKCGISEVTEESMSTHEINFGSRKEEPLRYKKFWDHIGTIFDKYDYEKTIKTSIKGDDRILRICSKASWHKGSTRFWRIQNDFIDGLL